MKKDLIEMSRLTMKIMNMIDVAQESESDSEALGALCGIQEALYDLDVIHAYLSRRTR